MTLAKLSLNLVWSQSNFRLHLSRTIRKFSTPVFSERCAHCTSYRSTSIYACQRFDSESKDRYRARGVYWVATEAFHKTKMNSIELTSVELLLRRLLLDVAEYINHDPPLELRFTGGWVRDKLLGVASHDIDVAINVMTGYQFGLKMKEYLEIPGNLAKYGLENADTSKRSSGPIEKTKAVHGLHKIAANPEKSKHLETVTTKVFGLDIDLVNLRKETYSDDSRNPQMDFGTPMEDALRRDATINAIFYNLSTKKIEDFTKRGIDDMARHLIRTPLEPHRTFKDDPLRVLRLIRFASRLNYAIDPEVEKYMMDDSIKAALCAKISRERIGVEIEKMLRGPNPHIAFQLIDRLGLYSTIFTDPLIDHNFSPDLGRFGLSYNAASIIISQSNQKEGLSTLIQNGDDLYLTWLLSAFTPYVDAPQSDHAKKLPVAACVAREGIKATNKFSDIIASSVQNLEDITGVVDQYVRQVKKFTNPYAEQDPAGRDTLGMAIRRWGPTWRNQLVFAMLVEASNSPKIPDEDFLKTLDERWQGYLSFFKEICNLKLLEAYNFKPLLDGKSLAKALSAKPGPWMKDALDVVMAWQLRNPESTDTEEAILMVKDRNPQGELTKALRRHFLKLTIPPLFAKTQNPDITTEGRRVVVQNPARRRYEAIEDESVTRPWKSDKLVSILDIMTWVVSSLDGKTTEENWPFLLPPLLTLVDDTEIKYKILGCNLLTTLLDSVSPEFLARTGLGGVFQDAIRPCLSYLPNLTPDIDSVNILNAAYPAALKVLQRSRDPSTTPHNTAKLLHEHLLPSLSHCSAHPSVVTALLGNTTLAIRTLGLDTVTHLQFLVPTLTALLVQPFGAIYPELIGAGARTMREVLLCAWPRVPRWRGEVLKGLVGAWFEVAGEEKRWKIEDADGESMLGRIGSAQVELRKCAAVLIRACEMARDAREAGLEEGNVDVKMEVAKLVDANSALEALFSERSGE